MCWTTTAFGVAGMVSPIKKKAPDFSDARFSHQGFDDCGDSKKACCGIHPDRNVYEKHHGHQG
jgi:hypothetical protein